MKNALIINAHQFYENFSEGKLNESLVEVAKKEFEEKGYSVKITNIEKGYKVADEIDKHEWADIIITQSPVYWFSTPWIHKKYIDEVLTTAMADGRLAIGDGRSRKDVKKEYGTGGSMKNTKFALCLTWNAPEEAFEDKEQFLHEGKSVDDIFAHMNTTYKFCGCEIIPSFSLYNVFKMPDVLNDIEKYKNYLKQF